MVARWLLRHVGADRALSVLIRSNLEKGQVEACLKVLIHLGANAIHEDRHHFSPNPINALEVAALRGKSVALHALVASHKFPPPLLDRAVQRVARSGIGQEWNGDAVRTLVDGGADPNAVDGDGMTPIMWAARRCNTSVFAALVERGANLEAVCTKKGAIPVQIGWTVTMWAVHGGDASVVTALSAQGADLNKADIVGMTPTLLAIRQDHDEVFEALVNGGADINKADNEGKTPTLLAVWFGQPSIVTALAARGADLNKADIGGMTPTILAILRQDHKAFKALVNGGADINLADNEGKTPLMWLSQPTFDRRKARISVGMLVSAGADLDSVDNNGMSALMWAALTGASNAVVAALIRHGANLHLASHNGDTATALAIGSGHSAIVSALRVAGAH
jgi:ankyrin repeat protein